VFAVFAVFNKVFMQIQLKFFASVREALGTSSESLTIPDDINTVAALREYLLARGGVWAEALAHGRALRMAVNQQMVNGDAFLNDGAEVAFFPPVTGG
jgi:sulfur-carrier protein